MRVSAAGESARMPRRRTADTATPNSSRPSSPMLRPTPAAPSGTITERRRASAPAPASPASLLPWKKPRISA